MLVLILITTVIELKNIKKNIIDFKIIIEFTIYNYNGI
jgi:hypothetical protein